VPYMTVRWIALLFFAIVVFGSGCAIQDKAYLQASKEDTIEAYQDYIAKNPGAPNLQHAQTRLVKLQEEEQKALENLRLKHEDFLNAQAAGTVHSYNEYLNKHTNQYNRDNEEDVDTRLAVEEFRRLAAIEVLENEASAGNSTKSGAEFPMDLFTIQDLLISGGVMLMHFGIIETEVEKRIGISGKSGTIIGKVNSSKEPSVSVVFYNDPDDPLSFEITVKHSAPPQPAGVTKRSLSSFKKLVIASIELPEELQEGRDQTIKLAGKSLAIVTQGKTKQIYVFGEWPNSQ